MQRIAEGLKTPFYPYYSGTRYCSTPVIRTGYEARRMADKATLRAFFFWGIQGRDRELSPVSTLYPKCAFLEKEGI